MHTTSLIIADSRPLIDLALADELDTLSTLAPNLRILVPDMVRHDLIARIAQTGAPDALEWLRLNEDGNISVPCTEELEEFIVLKHGATRFGSRHHNELAAAEVLGRELSRRVEAVILLLDDARIGHAPFLNSLPDNVLLLSTTSYLQKLKSRQIRPAVGAMLQRVMAMTRPYV